MPLRLLIVDDDPIFRRTIGAVLSDRGYLVVGEANTIRDARLAISTLAPDALLLDINLADGNGLAFATELHANTGSPRVLLTSTDAGAAPPRLLARSGASFIAKADLLVTDLSSLLGS
jgi:DNA-binding NarL/FixJ family response regulator